MARTGELARARETVPAGRTSPAHAAVEVSILLPTWGRRAPLERCLDALESELGQLGSACEVLTIHAPGDDPSLAMIARRFPWVRALQAPQRNLSLQRNLGARRARGKILIYLDDDAWPAAGWLAALLEPFRDPAIAAAGGKVLHPDGSLQYGPMAVTPLGRPFPLASAAERPAHLPFTLPGGNLAVRRRALFAIGGFDENYRYHFDDVDLSMRLFRAGGVLAYAPKASVFHESCSGPHRRNCWDRDWYTVAKNSIYFAFRHARHQPLLLLLAPLLLQAPKAARLLGWTLRGRLSPAALLRCLSLHTLGIAAGYAKGLCSSPRLPLRRERDEPSSSSG